jgi:hypothetical protein
VTHNPPQTQAPCEALCRTRTDDPLLTIKVQGQRVATRGNGCGLIWGFRRSRVCHRLPLIAPARLHKRSIRVGQFRFR